MQGLESKQMPLRTLDRFYESKQKQKSPQGIKVFPSKHVLIQQVISPKGQLPSVFTYISGLNRAKNIPRCIGNKKQYYPYAKSCRRHKSRFRNFGQSNPQKQQSLQDIKSRLQSLGSSSPTNRSMMVFSHINNQQKHLNDTRNKFRQTHSLHKQEKDKQMRFSFYNTVEKSQFFLKRFKQDTFIKQRGTNNYQNVFKRTITTQNIMNLVKKSKEKYKIGF